ncbi:MAG: GNAT family N-acetyltransferase [Dehalococcoidia bacterium]
MDPEFERLVVASDAFLAIRRKHPGDVHADWRWRNDPVTARFDGAEPVSGSFAEFAAQHQAQVAAPDPNRQQFSLVLPDGTHFGNVMFYNVSPALDQAELGISIGESSCRDRGLGTAAMVLFVRFLFETRPFRRLVLHTFDWNHRAFACFEHAGFAATGDVVYREGGNKLLRMVARREWWLMRDEQGGYAPDRRRREPSQG